MSDAQLGQASRVHRFFKGCTRPAMFLSVPLIPFLLISGIFLILGVWLFYLVSPYVGLVVVLTYIPLLVWMRTVSKRDDQRLKQIMMRARMRIRQSSKQRWGSISYSPLRYKKRA